jgi:hypothetical protein
MVDGAPRDGTACTLSHWPGTPTPEDLWRDLSAEIVLEALARPERLPGGVDAATIDHYDADGVISLAMLCVEDLATSYGPLLVEAARVGDFDVVTRRDAALVAFALRGIMVGDCVAHEPDDATSGGLGFLALCARAADEALRILPELAADPSRHEALWRGEAAAFDAGRDALARGWASIEERPEHDLAIVRVDTSHPAAAEAAWDGAPLHRAVVHSDTDLLRVATLTASRFELRYRYESWVRLVSRRPRPRVDLAPVARQLTEAEPDRARWSFDGAGAITPALHLDGKQPSGLSPDLFVDVVGEQLAALDAGVPAWDPYAASAVPS